MVFGPDKLPKLIQDVAGFVRKVRRFSDDAKQDIRSELGPEFKDFEFEDLNPKNFARKHLMENDDLGVKEIQNSFDLRKDLAEITDAVNGTERADSGADDSAGMAAREDTGGATERTSLVKGDGRQPSPTKAEAARSGRVEPPPFDSDAT
ncbi:sec-independent translocase [Streptomyces oceani]|uniref:Sec-independent protein translocase protein TatB n=1 Tax=Streptomyces oceani TaxID=1075402 RepID=A0A1E7KPY6_9ACTN|nr:hypothetical protein AN216_00935 [Streptomyces oceani]